MLLVQLISCLIAITYIGAVPVGLIPNSSLALSSSNITIQQSSCKKCVCMMFNATSNITFQSLNCYVNDGNNVTCQMFTTDMYLNSSFFQIIGDARSTFYFRSLPSINELTTASTITTAGYITILSEHRFIMKK